MEEEWRQWWRDRRRLREKGKGDGKRERWARYMYVEQEYFTYWDTEKLHIVR